jgi:hypothetical protein
MLCGLQLHQHHTEYPENQSAGSKVTGGMGHMIPFLLNKESKIKMKHTTIMI